MADVNVTITLPAAQVSRIVHALCVASGLPESPANAKQALLGWVKQTVRNVEMSEANSAALAAVTVNDVTPQ